MHIDWGCCSQKALKCIVLESHKGSPTLLLLQNVACCCMCFAIPLCVKAHMQDVCIGALLAATPVSEISLTICADGSMCFLSSMAKHKTCSSHNKNDACILLTICRQQFAPCLICEMTAGSVAWKAWFCCPSQSCARKPECLMSHNWLHIPDRKVINKISKMNE